jgi:hypothetical protein
VFGGGGVAEVGVLVTDLLFFNCAVDLVFTFVFCGGEELRW